MPGLFQQCDLKTFKNVLKKYKYSPHPFFNLVMINNNITCSNIYLQIPNEIQVQDVVVDTRVPVSNGHYLQNNRGQRGYGVSQGYQFKNYLE